MFSRTQCLKCGSTRIIPNAQLAANSNRLTVAVAEHPEALLFRGTHLGHPRAWVCGTCGYTEIYVDNPEELWDAYERSQNFAESDRT